MGLESIDKGDSSSKELVEFLLNHRGVLESSTRCATIKHILTCMQKEPDTAFYQVADCFTLLDEVLTELTNLKIDLAQRASGSINTLDLTPEQIQEVMEENRKRKDDG